MAAIRERLPGSTVPPFELRLDDGSVHRLKGGAVESGGADPAFVLTVRNTRGGLALASLDELRIGEAYLRGDLDMDGDFLAALDLRQLMTNRHWFQSLLRFAVPIARGQRGSDLAWVPHHYDFGNDFYFTFLDKFVGLYSQALYTAEDQSLETAVRNKLDYIVEICRLGHGSRVLDVGGGWGSFEKYVGAKGVDVTMLTISNAQFEYLAAWTASHDLPCRLEAVYESIFTYRSAQPYDAVVLLGVMEHLPAYRKLFAQFARLLKPGGYVYMDFAAGEKKFDVSAFTYRYVFPGNHTPVYLPGLFDAANRHGFEPLAVHNDRHSYFLTLQAWARNLEQARDELVAKVGEAVYRMFRLYLWGGAQQLNRNGSLESYRVVFQRVRGCPSSAIGVYRAV